MKLKKCIFFSFLAASTLLGCKKDIIPSTSNQQDKFPWSITTASINGTPWGDCQKSIFTGNELPKSTTEYYQNGHFSIYASDLCTPHDRSSTSVVGIGIRVNEVLEEGKTYIIGSSNVALVSGWRGNFIHFSAKTNDENLGELQITKFQNNRISGHFTYRAVIDSINLVMNVTEGSFEDLPLLKL